MSSLVKGLSSLLKIRVTASLLLFCLLTCAHAFASQDGKNQSQLQVFVSVKDGQLIVDRSKSVFSPSQIFKSRSRLSDAEARKILYDDLDRSFALVGKLYRLALGNDELALDDKGELSDAATNNIRTFTDDWQTFSAEFNTWANAGARTQIAGVFSGTGVMDRLVNAVAGTAFIFDTDDPTQWDATTGEIDFQVTDPIGDLNNANDYLITFPDQSTGAVIIAKKDDIVKLLKPLKGKLWRADDIRSRIEEFYTAIGLLPNITIPSAMDEPKEIKIQESYRIARIILPTSDDIPVDQILYLLLPDKEFRAFLRNRSQIMSDSIDTAGQPGLRAVDYVKHLGRRPGSEPYLNLFQMQIQQQQLAPLGFTTVQAISNSRPQLDQISYFDLQVQKLADSTQAAGGKTTKTTAAPPLANEQGVIDPNLQGAQRKTEFTPTASKPDDSTQSPGASSNNDDSKEKKNYIGGGFMYAPGQGIRLIGLAQRSKIGLLSDQDSFSVKAGGQGSGLGAANYFADYVAFGLLHRRLSVQFTGSSDFTASRLFAGVKTDERRTGALGRGELEMFRDLGGSLLRLYAEGRRATVELTQKGATAGKMNLTTIDVGSFYLFNRSVARYPTTLKLEPRLRLGLGLASGEPVYRYFSLAGNFHKKLPALFETDISGKLGLASRDTPVFEQPSFGGAEVVRGFRQDDAIGRKLWSLQSELWVPVPGSGNASDGLSQFLRRSLRIAGFVDVGGIYKTTLSKSGARIGPGLGLRIIYNPVVLKMDWAYGIGDGAASKGHGRFYFSVSTNLPF